MKIAVKGGGWYGCHIAMSLLRDGHDVTLYEKHHLFAGASGAIPARIHRGYHYPRSGATRTACIEHLAEFEDAYRTLIRYPPLNFYAVAAYDSLVDFATYKLVCGETPGLKDTLTANSCAALGIQNIEGALRVTEGHVLIGPVRAYFTEILGQHVVYGEEPPPDVLAIDCTFCANHNVGVARYEPCVTFLYEGPTDMALTIMDGPFPSLYPWDEHRRLLSLTSARHTPFCRAETYEEARAALNAVTAASLAARRVLMEDDFATYFPAFRDVYRNVDALFGIRAMPRSASDARLVECRWVESRTIAVRAGKIDAVFAAVRQIQGMLQDLERR